MRRVSGKKKLLTKILKIALVLVFLGLFLSCSFYFATEVIFAGKIYPGVKVEGVLLSLLQKKEAEKRIKTHFLSSLNKPLLVKYEGGEKKVFSSQFSAEVNTSDTIEKAYLIGRRGSFFVKVWERFYGLFSSFNVPLKISVDHRAVQRFIDSLSKEVEKVPCNAQFKIEGKLVKIIPSKDGFKIQKKDATFALLNALKKKDRTVKIKGVVVKPELTTYEAQAMGIKERISVFTTTYSSSNRSRVKNIKLLARALDRTLVAPGEVFSFNKVVGPRTAEKGYEEAPQILSGELVPAVGGGSCQVGTTLFNVVFFGGYPVLERRNHSFYISHYPAGRDCAISWPHPDLKFRNDTTAFILIRAWASSSSITIAFYSTDFGRKVFYTTSPFTNFVPYPTKRIEDPTLPQGTEVKEASGIEGRSIIVFRVVKRDGKIIRKDKFFSKYGPKKEIIRVGTAKPPQPIVPVLPPSSAPAPLEEEQQQNLSDGSR